jgi:enoyl-[acyl-carrier protein] reductase II
MSPGVYLDTPDDFTTLPMELIDNERKGISAVYSGDKEKALMAGGECAQRVQDLPAVQELVDGIINDAAAIVKTMPRFLSTN